MIMTLMVRESQRRESHPAHLPMQYILSTGDLIYIIYQSNGGTTRSIEGPLQAESLMDIRNVEF